MTKTTFAAAVLTSLVLGLLACHRTQPAPTNPPGSWVWYSGQGVYTYWTPSPDGGLGTWTWASPPRAAPTSVPHAPPHVLGAATPATWTWVAITGADHGSIATSAGYLFDIHCVLTVLAGGQATPLYVMGFDQSATTVPSNGTAPIAGLGSGGLSAAGNDVAYDDEEYAHGTINFTSGLLLALSTTDDTFTAPTAGNQMRCDAKVSAKR